MRNLEYITEKYPNAEIRIYGDWNFSGWLGWIPEDDSNIYMRNRLAKRDQNSDSQKVPQAPSRRPRRPDVCSRHVPFAA